MTQTMTRTIARQCDDGNTYNTNVHSEGDNNADNTNSHGDGDDDADNDKDNSMSMR